jgi:flagellar motor switch protein FliN/FliY
VEIVSLSDLMARTDTALQTIFSLSQPQGAESAFVVPEEAACILASLLEGGDGSNSPDTLSEAHIDALTNSMNGMVRGFATAISNFTGEIYDLETSSTHSGMLTIPPVFALEGSAIEVYFTLSIPDVLDTTITALFTSEFISELTPQAVGRGTSGSALNGSDALLSEDDVAAMFSQVASEEGDFPGHAGSMAPSLGMSGGNSPFSSMLGAGQESHLPRGLEMILDIPLDVTVELGRVRMLIKDVLELSSGSIIELDRVAGEPVDLLVNGRLVAKGEVVVIEDNFGIRITEIVSPAERVSGLGKGR